MVNPATETSYELVIENILANAIFMKDRQMKHRVIFKLKNSFPAYRGSPLLFIAEFLAKILQILGPLGLIRLYGKKKKEPVPMAWVDIWVLGLLIVELISLILLDFDVSWLRYLCFLFGIYGLVEVLAATSRDIILAPIIHKGSNGGYIQIRSRRRWLILTVFNLAQIIVCFGILIYYYKDQFTGNISSWVTALYISFVSFTTLGYGDFSPKCDTTRWIVIAELSYFLFFLIIKISTAVSVIRVKKKGLHRLTD